MRSHRSSMYRTLGAAWHTCAASALCCVHTMQAQAFLDRRPLRGLRKPLFSSQHIPCPTALRLVRHSACLHKQRLCTTGRSQVAQFVDCSRVQGPATWISAKVVAQAHVGHAPNWIQQQMRQQQKVRRLAPCESATQLWTYNVQCDRCMKVQTWENPPQKGWNGKVVMRGVCLPVRVGGLRRRADGLHACVGGLHACVGGVRKRVEGLHACV